MSGGGSANGYVIERSLRFSATSSQYLTRTPAGAATNNKILTFSVWVKRGLLGSPQQSLLSSPNGANADNFRFSTTDTLSIDFQDGAAGQLTTSQVFRDPSAFYHVVLAIDTTQATASNRAKLYINGTQVTAFGTASYPAQNTIVTFTSPNATYLGRYGNAAQNYFDGQFSEPIIVDGQALTPSSFGETNTVTGQWVAKRYTGTYGTKGFYLDFKDGTSTTTLGDDKSGNNNDWTLTNFTRSAGVNDCWMLDVPAGNGSASGTQPSSNYATLNPLGNTNSGEGTFSRGNLRVSGSSGAINCYAAGTQVASGKTYFEFTIGQVGNFGGVGIVPATSSQRAFASSMTTGIYYLFNGSKRVNGSTTSYGASYTNNDVIGVAVDVDAETVVFYKNNVSQGSISGTGLFANGMMTYIGFDDSNSPFVNANFGQRSFAYTPPTGFKALCTANLTSTDVIESGSFTGNASADGRYVWCNGTPETLTINGNAVTWGTHADRLSNGFKIRTSSSSYNSSGTNTWTATILSPESKSAFKHQNAKGN